MKKRGANLAVPAQEKKKSSATTKHSLASNAYKTIREKILKGEFTANAVLSRRQIADELKMSLPPVYEAIQRLESEGLLESKSRVGTRLRIPSREDVLDRGLVREALESQSARLFAERASTKQKNELVRKAARLDKLYDEWESGRADPEFLYKLNTLHLRLHVYIAICSRCVALREAIEREQTLIFNWFYDMVAQRRVLGHDFHSRLAAALVSGDPIKADAAMRQHIRFGLGEVLLNMVDMKNNSGWRLRRVK
jgi:DNA-binding GntR family transcriptional regulator